MRRTNDNFESVLVSQASIPTEPIPVPKDVIASDGKLLAHITHHTAPFTHTHCETLQFFIISSPHCRQNITQIGPQERLPPYSDSRRRRMEDGF